jgi:hypothetical protein
MVAPTVELVSTASTLSVRTILADRRLVPLGAVVL